MFICLFISSQLRSQSFVIPGRRSRLCSIESEKQEFVREFFFFFFSSHTVILSTEILAQHIISALI